MMKKLFEAVENAMYESSLATTLAVTRPVSGALRSEMGTSRIAVPDFRIHALAISITASRLDMTGFGCGSSAVGETPCSTPLSRSNSEFSSSCRVSNCLNLSSCSKGRPAWTR